MRIGTPVMRSVVFCLWCVALLPGVSVGQGDAPVVIPTAVKAMLARLLPEPSEVQAAPAGEPKFFSTDLYRYIDGGADTYLDYGLVAMVHERYRASAADVTVSWYNLGAPSSTLAFMLRKVRRITTPPSGRKAMARTKSSTSFRRSGTLSCLPSAAGRGLGRCWSASPADRFAEIQARPGHYPSFFLFFQTRNLVGHSAKFVRKSPLGTRFSWPRHPGRLHAGREGNHAPHLESGGRERSGREGEQATGILRAHG